ncbi:MAG TPA: hypothetical protein VF920_00195, partial [Dongiaceae bacterium]
MLPVSVDLHRMAVACRQCHVEALQHRIAFALIVLKAMEATAKIIGLQGCPEIGQGSFRGLAAAIINKKNWQTLSPATSNDRRRCLPVIMAWN